MELKIFVRDQIYADYEDAKMQLAVDYYTGKLGEFEINDLKKNIAKYVLIKKYEQRIMDIDSGTSPYDFDNTINDEVDKIIKREVKIHHGV